MKKAIIGLCYISAIMVLSTAIWAAPENSSKQTGDTFNPNTTRRLVFVQNAPSATLKHNNSQDTYTLKMQFTADNPHVLYLSDQPNRIAGYISLTQFLEAWNDHPNGFKKSPPHAVLLYNQFQATSKHGIHMSILTLHNPKWQAKTHSLSYTVTANNQNHKIKEGKYHNISLLIDRLVRIQ